MADTKKLYMQKDLNNIGFFLFKLRIIPNEGVIEPQ